MAVSMIEPPATASLLGALITGQLTLARTMGRDPESKKVHESITRLLGSVEMKVLLLVRI
jgi:hypothetical protein